MNPIQHEPAPHADVQIAVQADTDRVAANDATLDAPAHSIFDTPLNTLSMADPLRWVAAGWQDFRRAPALGLTYGAFFAVMGWLLLGAFRYAPAYTLALSAGFLLVGPLLCLGLYEASRRLERGERPVITDSLFVWERHIGTLAIFGAVLLILEMLWARASLVVFALSFDGMPDFQGSVFKLLSPENLGFIVTYLAVGGIFAGWIFAVSVISMPMLLDRKVDAISAGLTSIRLVVTQPLVMLWWGLLITALVVGPVIGHATWHAYRAALPREAARPEAGNPAANV